jgi:hypothetical protein
VIFIKNAEVYPLFIGDLLLDFPKWKSGDQIPQGWGRVVESQRPIPGNQQKVVELFPNEDNGVWYQQWEVLDLTDEEIEMLSSDLKDDTIVRDVIN